LILEPSTEPQVLRIFDFSGKLQLETQLEAGVNNIQIPINLISGVYVVQLLKDSLTMFTQKMIVTEL
jgi:hypothetical protein